MITVLLSRSDKTWTAQAEEVRLKTKVDFGYDDVECEASEAVLRAGSDDLLDYMVGAYVRLSEGGPKFFSPFIFWDEPDEVIHAYLPDVLVSWLRCVYAVETHWAGWENPFYEMLVGLLDEAVLHSITPADKKFEATVYDGTALRRFTSRRKFEDWANAFLAGVAWVDSRH